MDSSKYLEEAVRIGDEILSRKKVVNGIFFWETLGMWGTDEISWKVSESIYSGVAGVVLFYMELYRQTLDKKYYQAVLKGLNWLIENENNHPNTNTAFLTGRLGVAYILIQAYELTKDKLYYDEAVRIALRDKNLKSNSRRADDLLNGTSGTLLAYLILHEKTQENKFLPIIDRLTDHLIKNLYHGIEGVYWDRSSKQIRGLCGFSHGTSGIGYVFLELGYYFNNPTFYWLAEQAFAYENYFFDKERNNWPDFRKSAYSEDLLENFKKNYLQGNTNFFYAAGNMSAWCHGAPGIGLSRLKAWQILKKKYLKTDLDNALVNTKKSTLSALNSSNTFTLCHGMGGNAVLFLEEYKYAKNGQYLELARKVADQAIEYQKKFGFYVSGFGQKAPYSKSFEDVSLFRGNAGIGYYYLMCNMPDSIDSILSPTVTETCKTDISSSDVLNIKLSNLKRRILSKAFPRTVKLVEDKYKKEMNFFLESEPNSKDLKVAFSGYINNLQPDKKKRSELIKSILQFEEKKLEIDLNTNFSLQNIKSILLGEQVENLLSFSDDEMLKLDLVLNDDLTIDENIQNSASSQAGIKPENNQYQYVILLKSTMGVQEHYASNFTVEVLEAFTKSNNVNEVKKSLISEFELEEEHEKKKFEELYLYQVRECIHSFFLVKQLENNQTPNSN